MEMGCQGDLVTWEEMQQPLVLRPGRVAGSSLQPASREAMCKADR